MDVFGGESHLINKEYDRTIYRRLIEIRIHFAGKEKEKRSKAVIATSQTYNE